MLVVRCKTCNKELSSSSKTQICGCSNMMTLKDDKVTAIDLSKVVMVRSNKEREQKSSFSPSELAYQEARRNRKVRKLDFEVR
jgi:hypothetical protein